MLALSTPLDVWTPLKKFPVSPSSLHWAQHDTVGEGLVERRRSFPFWVFHPSARNTGCLQELASALQYFC